MDQNNSDMKWERVELGEVCTPKQWKTISTKNLLPSGYPVYGANGIIGYYNKYSHEHPTIAITCRGATCGKINITEPCSYINGNAMALDNLSEKVNLNFLAYFFKFRGFSDVISGSAQPQIIKSNLKSLKIPLPPLPEQRRLAARLDKADALRQKSRAVVEAYAALGRSVFLEVFGDPVRNERGWEVVELASLIPKNEKIAYGIVQPGKEDPSGIPIVRVKDFDSMSIDTSNLKRVSPKVDEKHKKTRLIGNEILIACVGSIGKVAIVDKSLQNANIVRATARIPANESRINRTFLAYYLSSKFVQDYFIKTTRTVSQPTLNIKQIKETPILLPPLDLQTRFARMVANIEAQRRLAERQLEAAEAVFGGVLQGTFG